MQLSIMSMVYMMGVVRAGDFELLNYTKIISKKEFGHINVTAQNDKRLYLTFERDEYQQIYTEMEIQGKVFRLLPTFQTSSMVVVDEGCNKSSCPNATVKYDSNETASDKNETTQIDFFQTDKGL